MHHVPKNFLQSIQLAISIYIQVFIKIHNFAPLYYLSHNGRMYLILYDNNDYTGGLGIGSTKHLGITR